VYRLVLGVRTAPHRVGGSAVRLDVDDQLCVGTRPVGRFRWIPLPGALATFPWLVTAPPCAWVEPVGAVLSWELWEGDLPLEQRIDIAADLLSTSLGLLARADGSGLFDLIGERAFPLAHASSKGGFDDGDFFLDAPGYAAYVGHTLGGALARLGLRGEISNVPGSATHFGTSHNPYRIEQVTTMNGASGWDRLAAAADTPVRLWGRDWAGFAAAMPLLLADPP
jgi:hypothetical protein